MVGEKVTQKPHQKLPRLPEGTKISKRPLFHDEIPSPYAGKSKQKVVYISMSTPFTSAVKRIEKLLRPIEQRHNQTELSRQKKLKGRRGQYLPPPSPTDIGVEEVVVKATGKAIDNAMQVALFLQSKNDLAIKIRTGSATSIDDITPNEEQENVDDADELPESRLRQISVIEIGVTLKSG
ncbi:MAG: hypothetical protein Q9162_003828 [Coniocarpon cinnabarinum]